MTRGEKEQAQLSEVIDNIDMGCDGEAMALLTDEFTEQIDQEMIERLAWRAVWLHRALTDPSGDLLAPRDRELLVLVATSTLGVNCGAAIRHLRRFGTSPAAGQACIERLVHTGHLSATSDLRLDLPVSDLEWIEQRAASRGGV